METFRVCFWFFWFFLSLLALWWAYCVPHSAFYAIKRLGSASPQIGNFTIYNMEPKLCKFFFFFFYLSIALITVSFSHLHYNVRATCVWGNFLLKLQNGTKLPHIHARLYRDTKEKSLPWKGLMDKKTPNIEVCSESPWAILEYWYIERALVTWPIDTSEAASSLPCKRPGHPIGKFRSGVHLIVVTVGHFM